MLKLVLKKDIINMLDISYRTIKAKKDLENNQNFILDQDLNRLLGEEELKNYIYSIIIFRLNESL